VDRAARVRRLLERAAKRTTDPRRLVGLNLAGLARARVARGRRHPRRRARRRARGRADRRVLVAVAFTVYFGTSLLIHVTGGSEVSTGKKIGLAIFGIYLLDDHPSS
jgi:hypothetical protein